MAHTAIRLGYLSVSTGGGGGDTDNFKEYLNVENFPPSGQVSTIYLANDTKKIYKWNGVTYQELSPSEVTSVNSQVGDVVLTKADIGLDQVDNTSDADKPISDATQLALDGLDERTTSLENINEVLQIHAFEDNVQIWGSAQPPVIDPLANIYGNELVRDGWYFENTALGQQVAWYFFDGTTQATIQKSGFNCYAVLTMDVLTSKPIFGIYSFPTGSGDVLPGFAHSRWSYQISTANLATMTAGKKYLLYVGENPDVHPEVPHIPLDYVAAASGGDRLDTEIIFTSSLVSDPTEPVGEVKWLVESLGVSSALYKHEMALRIKKATQKDFLAHVNDTDNPHSVTASQVGLGNVDNTSDLDKPISTATQNALDDKEDLVNKSDNETLSEDSSTLYPTQHAVKSYIDTGLSTKIDSSEKGVADGVAPLNSSTKIDSVYLPSYVDDVEEYADLTSFPATGESGKIYVALDTNLTYRWSGSTYVEISPAPVQSVNGQINVVVLDSADINHSQVSEENWDIPNNSTISASLEELAARAYSLSQVTNEPTGFPDRTSSELSFSDSTPDRTLTIAPTGTHFDFYVKGRKFTKTSSESIQLPTTSGNHIVYYDANGDLQSTQAYTAELFEENALVSIVYWNADVSLHTYFADERHGLVMDGATHAYLHTSFGARYLSGYALQNFSVDGNGSLDSHAQFTSDSGTMRDEDIFIQGTAQTQIPVLFRQGDLWRKKQADSFPFIYSGSAGYTGANGRVPYNQLISGTWQLTEVANNGFVLMHYFSTNDIEASVVAIQGTNQYGDIPSAKEAAFSEIKALTGLPFAEFSPIGSVIIQTGDYSNSVKARVRSVDGGEYVDFRGTQPSAANVVVTSHGTLSGLSNDDHPQYLTEVRGDTRYLLKSIGDISETEFSISNNQSSLANITDFSFDNLDVRSFNALVSVEIEADSNLFELFEIKAIQKDSDWDLSISSSGDISGVSFSLTSSGQLQYISDNYSGFISGKIKFRAITTSM